MRIGYRSNFLLYIFDDVKVYQVKYMLDSVCENQSCVTFHTFKDRHCIVVDVSFFKDIRVEFFIKYLNTWFDFYRIEFA